MQCVFTEPSEFMFWCTNPSNEVCELSLCEGSFQVLGEKDDIRRLRREKSLSFGRLPWISAAYIKKTQASKLGDAWASPSS